MSSDARDAGEPNAQTRERLEAWAATLDDYDYYELLSVPELADSATIKAAYYRFARAFHPDRHVGDGARARELAARVFQRGAEAYRVLANADLRVRYDMARARGRRRMLASELPATASEIDTRPLHELCRSAGAKLAAQKAARLIDAGDPARAKAELMRALEHDGGVNPALSERIEALEIVLYAMGVES